MAETVLDASAVLAVLNGEPGSEMVAGTLPGAVVSAVNLSEVVAKLCEVGVPEKLVRQALEPLGLEVADFDIGQAFEAGLLYRSARCAGLSLGDRACLSLGKMRGATVLTADKMWAQLSLGVTVRVIR